MVKSRQSLTLPFLAIILTALVGAVVATAPPAGAQSGAPPVTNIAVCSGPSAGEVIISWDSVPQATYYRIGYVNMIQDYPLAKASATGEWIEAFIYVDVNAQNIPVNGGRGQYTLRRLVQGDNHAFTVLTSNDVVNTLETISGQYSWPEDPRLRWAFHTVTNPDPACSAAAPASPPAMPPAANTPLSNAELARRVRPALAKIVVVNAEEGTTSYGTGFVVSSDGLVVTNRHVVDDANTVSALMLAPDGSHLELTGQVLGRGILADLAVIRLPAGRTYPTLPLGDSDAVAQGDDITAWGYPSASFLGDDPTLTRGIISSTNRIFDDTRYIQTDAAIAPGNSGGPVVDRFGQVVGVNTATLVNADGNPIPGIYLAIASNEVNNRLNTMAAGGPERATYRNLRNGYGYSMDILKGWHIDDELPHYSDFWPYGRKAIAYISRYNFNQPSGVRSRDLDLLTDYRWERQLPDSAENWVLFEKISKRKVTRNGQEFYRLEYRRQASSRSCVSHRIELVSVSSSYPNQPIGFVTGVGVCVPHLATHSGERDTMLNSFRP